MSQKCNFPVIGASLDRNLPSEKELHQWVGERGEWVLGKLCEQKQRAQEVPKRHYCTGDRVLYLGADYSLNVVAASRSAVRFSLEQGFTF